MTSSEFPASSPESVASGSAEDVLEYVLSTELSPEKMESFIDSRSAYGKAISSAWHGVAPKHFKKAFLDPHYIPSANPADYADRDSFAQAMATEFAGRARENACWVTLEAVAGQVTDPDDFIKLVDVHEFLWQHSVGAEEGLTPQKFACRIIERSTALAEDAVDGSANPDEAADMALPAIVRILEQQLVPGARSRGAGIRSFSYLLSSKLLQESVLGTAERVAALRTRERLHKLGYTSFEPTTAAKQQAHNQSERYLTMATLDRIKESSQSIRNGVPEGAEAAQAIRDLTLALIAEHARQGNGAAEQLIEAFDHRRIGSGYVYRQPKKPSGTIPLTAMIDVANEFTPRLNETEQLAGDSELQLLDTHDLTELPYAFRRILFALDPGLLAQATAEVPLAEAPELRLHMIYVEALSGQWRDFIEAPGPNLSDHLLALKARGWSEVAISRHLEQLLAGPDTSGFRRAMVDPRTGRKHVVVMDRRSIRVTDPGS